MNAFAWIGVGIASVAILAIIGMAVVFWRIGNDLDRTVREIGGDPK